MLEDPRSLFLGFLYTFTKLPENPMRPRLADSRIGHFGTAKVNFSDDSKFLPVRWYVQRWRLEKKDPNAELSEVVKPITFYIGNEIPEKYREPIRQGILEWNKGFERIGLKDAIVVKQQPDDADYDLGETQYSSVRWMATATPSFGAIGPSQVDPRTGEILDADIGWDASQVRNIRALKTEGVVTYTPMYDAVSGELNPLQQVSRRRRCRTWRWGQQPPLLRPFRTRGARNRICDGAARSARRARSEQP